MDLTVIENLLKEFKDIKMFPFDGLLDVLNERFGIDIYSLFRNRISLKKHIDNESIREQGFVSAISAYHPFIESFYPLKISHKHGHINNLTIVSNDMQIDNSICIASKKKFLTDYFNNLKINSRGTLISLTHRKKTIQNKIDEINNNRENYISTYLSSKSFITEQEFINKNFVIVELPIFPTDKTLLAVVNKDKINGLRYAHDLNDLNYEYYIDDVESKEGYFIVCPYTVSQYQLTPLDNSQVLDIFPDIYDDISNVVRRKNRLEEEIIDIEKERALIEDLKKEENFIKVIKYIEDNIN